MNEKQKLIDLLSEKKELLAEMRKANDEENQSAFDAAQQKMNALDEKIKRTEAIIQTKENVDNALPKESGKSPEAKDCLHAFCEALRAQVRQDIMAFNENRTIVNAGLNETQPAEGGLLVPADIQTRINELRRTLNPLSKFFNVENVSALTGTRVIDSAPDKGFTDVAEFAAIPQDDQPTFRQIEYKVRKYALIIPVSNDLLKDSDENILSYLTRWFAKKGVLTENKLLSGLLAALDTQAVTAAAGKELAAIKEVLNVKLDPAISLTASFVTNQDGFNYLDTLEDKNGRPLLQPDPANGTTKMLLGHPIHVVSSAVLPNPTGGAPLYIGNFRQYGTLFRRRGLEVSVTDIGGNSWATDSTEIRGIMRLDAQTYDEQAAAAVLLAKAADSGKA